MAQYIDTDYRWTVGSKIKRNIMKYRDKLDDYELL